MADDKTFTKSELDEAVKAAVAKATDTLEAEVDALRTAKQELLDETKKAKAELRKVKDISPEDVAAIEAERDKAIADLAEAHKSVKTLTGERDKAVKALETESAFTQRLLIQDGLKSALIANGVKDEDYIDSLSAKFARDAKVVTEGEERKAMIGDKSLSEAIKEYASSDAGKKFVSAPENSGGGAGGGKGGEGGKSIDRASFDAMGQGERAAFVKDGGKVVDAAA